MLISLCTPIMNRLDDLLITMPYRINAANAYPPIEIAVADYNSSDGLQEYIENLMATTKFENGSFFNYRRYEKRNSWHMAHGFNIAMTMANGDYLVATAADHYFEDGYIPALYALIEDGCLWATAAKLKNLIAIERNEFYSCGGYDEHFELYGPEDLDIQERLTRRGAKFGLIPNGLVKAIFTPEEKKFLNYRIKTNKKDASARMIPHLEENRRNNSLVANAGIEWGKW